MTDRQTKADVSFKLDETKFHSAADVLVYANRMMGMGHPILQCGTVLESMEALERFVGHTVLRSLESKLGPSFVAWLRRNTAMDFDARMELLLPLATGKPIDKTSVLWVDYRAARRLQNEIARGGREVTESEVRRVVKVVADWVDFLSCTVELGNMLRRLKATMELAPPAIASGSEAEKFVVDFLRDARASVSRDRHADVVVVGFGGSKVAIAVKLLSTVAGSGESVSQEITSLQARVVNSVFERGYLVVLVRSAPNELPTVVHENCGGMIETIFVGIGVA